MTISLVQQPDTAYNGGATSLGNTFSVAPTAGNLIVFTVIVANNATITSDDGTLTEVQTGYEAFRRISTFAKIAGGAEPVTYDFTVSISSTCWVYATEYSTTDSWAVVSSGVKTIDFDSSGSNFEITSTGIATTAGSLLVASGYSGNSTTNNQEINTGFSNFVQPLSTGTTRRTAQADKTSLGGSQTAEFSLTDEATSTRLAVALVEFKIIPGGPRIDSNEDPIYLDSISAHTVSNFSTTINQASLTVGTATLDADSANNTQSVWPELSDGMNIIPFGVSATLRLEFVPEFIPAVIRTFNNGTTGQSAQSEFDSGASEAVYSDVNPYNGTKYINSTALANDANTFDFGGYLSLPVNLVEGDEVWIQTMIRPEDALWTDSSPHLKFLRLREETALGANSGYNDVYMDDATGDIKYIKEGVNTWYYAKNSGTSTTPPSNIGAATVATWNRYEFYINLHSDPAQGVVRVWKDNVLILEATTQTMNNSDGYSNQFLLFTYWNGETALPSSPHTVGIDNIVIGTSASPPINTDSDGNSFIGSYL